MKLFVFAVFALVILQVMAAPPSVESEEVVENGEEVEIDPAKLRLAIKNVGKLYRALKQVDADLRAQPWDVDGHHKTIHTKSIVGDIGSMLSTLGKWF